MDLYNIILNILRKVRGFIFRNLNPSADILAIRPMSRKYGFDRGTPVDRVYIEKFLNKNSKHIRGKCLEINTDKYTKKFGQEKVSEIEIMDIDPKNRKATLIGDLRELSEVKSSTYDCLILTQTFGVIDDYQSAIKESFRILKKNGTLLATVASMGPLNEPESSYWRFNPKGAEFAFSEVFGTKNVDIQSYGNFYTGLAFWMGLAAEELDESKFKSDDKNFPFLIGIKAIKK